MIEKGDKGASGVNVNHAGPSSTGSYMTDAPNAEWVVWEGPRGFVLLEDGRRVAVRGGDELLVVEVRETVSFLEHRPAQRH